MIHRLLIDGIKNYPKGTGKLESILYASNLLPGSGAVDSRYLDFTYLEVKISSLFVHENVTTGNKIFWKKTEKLLLRRNFFSFPQYFRSQLHIHLKCSCLNYFFPHFCKSDLSRYGYLEVFQSLLDFEITRVDCFVKYKIAVRLVKRLPY